MNVQDIKEQLKEISHPKHYTSSAASCDYCGCTIEAIQITRHLESNIANIIKYLWRFKLKDGLKDLRKARWYLDDEINRQEKLEAKKNG